MHSLKNVYEVRACRAVGLVIPSASYVRRYRKGFNKCVYWQEVCTMPGVGNPRP
jgi:hypothetical protein